MFDFIDNYLLLFTVFRFCLISLGLLIFGISIGTFFAFRYKRPEDTSYYDSHVSNSAVSNYCNLMSESFPMFKETKHFLLFLDDSSYLTRRRETLSDHRNTMIDKYGATS